MLALLNRSCFGSAQPWGQYTTLIEVALQGTPSPKIPKKKPLFQSAQCQYTTLSVVALQGKPSAKTPKKKRFFQLSHDGSTLRWSWNKYIVMYYVEVSIARH